MAPLSSLAGLLAFIAFSNAASTTSSASISPKVPATAPSNAVAASSVLISFSLEGDQWPMWASVAPNFNTRNNFFFNTLQNLHDRTGAWPDIRVGANSEDRTAFDNRVIQETVPPPTTSMPYPEGQNITVSETFYSLSKFLPSGTSMTWGFNFGAGSLTLATTELQAILDTFSKPTSQGGVVGSGVTLTLVELGNEPDLFGGNGHRASGYDVADYTTEWRQYITSLLSSTALGSASAPKIQAMSFANSDFGAGNFSPQQAIKDGILNGTIKQHVGAISQHRYSGGCCTARIQDLMDKNLIRKNLTGFEGDIAAVKQTGIPYYFGETNTYFNHGVPKISDAGGAAVWLADYTLFGATIGIEKMYFHEGIGYKYNLIQPASLPRNVDDATTLNPPAPPHVQSSYYGALAVNEFLGTTSSRHIVEIDFSSTPTLSGYASYSSSTGAIQRIILLNHQPFLSSSSGTRPSLSVSLSSALGTKNISVKRLSIPFADVETGLKWAGQSFDGGVASGSVQVQTQSTSAPVVVSATEVVLVQF